MKLRIKSYNRHILLPTILFLIIFGVINLIILYANISGIMDIKKDLGMFLTTGVIFLVLAFIFIYFKVIQAKYFVFTKNKIFIYIKEKIIKVIEVDKIQSMNYYPFRIHYFITIYLGALKEGGAWKIHIKDIKGTKYEIAFISEKDALVLKEKLYPELLVIKYANSKRI